MHDGLELRHRTNQTNSDPDILELQRNTVGYAFASNLESYCAGSLMYPELLKEFINSEDTRSTGRRLVRFVISGGYIQEYTV